MFKQNFVFLSLVLLILSIPIFPAHAQGQDIILTLAVPDFFREFFEEQVIAEFEAANPGIQLHIVPSGGFGTPLNPDADIEDYLDSVGDYVSTADVVIVDANVLPEATRAGYFLDLSPLVNSDPTLNSADFYTALWNSFQWDGGMWALPVAGDAILLFYDPVAFDTAGLAYPDASWTINDLDFAVRTLTQTDPGGEVVAPGLLNFADLGTVIISMLGQSVYDDGTFPTLPRFDNPQLETILTTWAEMEADGLFTLPEDIGLGLENVPMFLSGTTLASVGGPNQTPRYASVLPGGRGGVTATGFGISSGTQYPEAAYTLIKFLATNPLVSNSFFGNRPANRNIEFGGGFGPNVVFGGGQGPGGGGGQGGPGGGINNAQSDQTEALIQTTLDNGIPVSETVFANRFTTVVTDMVGNNVDARTALQTVEADIISRLDVASARRDTVQVVVATPILEPELAPGEVLINFGLTSVVNPSPDLDRWQSAAQDFAASDSEVGFVSLDSSIQNQSVTEMAAEYDCFYTPSNAVPTVDLDVIRSIDPLIASDPSFDREDFVGNSLALVTRNNQIWAFPFSIQPVAMRYDPAQFANSGAFEPFVGWTVSDFETALRSFTLDPDADAPFVPGGFGSTNLLMLIASYGGLPIDYRTDPPTLNFTDPATVEAIRQVLNLARDGYMDYSELTGGGGFVFTFSDEVPALTIDTISGFGAFTVVGGGGGGGGNFTATVTTNAQSNDDTRLATFPRGTQYVPLSYQLGVGYISANSQVAEACYRFFSFLSQRAELYQTMPARRSMINHPDVAATQGDDRVTFYRAMDESMQQPNAIIIESIALGGGGGANLISTVLETYWLNRAFDRYVLEDADLEAELAEAEVFTRAFMECSAGITPPTGGGGPGGGGGFANQFIACVTQVDPTAQIFGN